MIPHLQTERLTLRPMRMEDWPDYERLMASERSVHMGGPFLQREAWGMFCHDAGLWSLVGHGALMMEDRESGVGLGQIGINAGPLFPERELGWFVYEQAEGKGYAFEAAHAMRDWAFEVAQMSTLVSYISPQNWRSCRLAKALGGALDEAAPRRDVKDLVYRYSPNHIVSRMSSNILV